MPNGQHHPVESVDLRDTDQNAATQDILAGVQQFAEREEDKEMESACEDLIELIQEYYVPHKPITYDHQQQQRIEQLEATNQHLEREVANHYATIRTMSGELTAAHDKIRDYESRIRDAQDRLG